MRSVDRFESMFRAATRDVFRYEAIKIDSVLVVTDRDESGARAFGDLVRGFLAVIDEESGAAWRDVAGGEYRTAADLLDLVGVSSPDLICTYRNLHSTAWRWPYSLGAHLDLLTQHTAIPVMVLPHPQAERLADHALQNTDTIMAITDHLAADSRLVNYALRFTEAGGTVWLTHVENEAIFERYMAVIAKIPEIDTDQAREELRKQLLKEPREYIASCAATLEAEKRPQNLETAVTFGRRLSEYRRLIEAHKIDLLVLNTKDGDQLAMHGMAYELAVELRHIPLLML